MNAGQRVLQFSCQGSALIGVIDVPERPIGRGLLVVSGQPQYRVGSGRHFTLLARQLAPRGIPVMRFDCRGMGDSEGEPRAADEMADDIAAAIREFQLHLPDLAEIVLWGLGEGASAAALYAHTDARVRGLVLLNPAAGGADGARKGLLPQVLARCGEIGFWKKVGNGHAVAVDPEMPLPQRLVASLACFSGASLIVIGGSDATGRAFADLLEHNDTERRCVTIAGADHTFSRPAWRDEVAELSASWIVSW
jgi:pimeloyl-ACP methyl ester carboxylesterase